MNYLTAYMKEIVFAGICGIFFFLHFIPQPSTQLSPLLLCALTAVLIAFLAHRKERWTCTITLSIAAIIITAILWGTLSVGAIAMLVSQDPALPFFRYFSAVLTTILQILTTYGLLTITAYSLGDQIIRRIPPVRDRIAGWLAAAVKLGLGFYSIILAYYTLSLVHALYLSPYLLLIVLWAVLTYGVSVFRFLGKRITLRLGNDLSDRRVVESWLGIGLVISATFFLLHYTKVPYAGDDWRIYLNIPKTFLEQGGYTFFAYDPSNQSPFISTYLILPLLQTGVGIASMFNVYFFVLNLIIFFLFVRTHWQDRAAFYATLLYAALPINLFFLPTVRPDMYLFFNILLTLALLWKHRFSYAQYILAGLFSGMAFGLKYTALYSAPLILAAVFSIRLPFKKIAMATAALLFSAIVAFAPWGAFNIMRYGNFSHPFTQSNHYAVYANDPETTHILAAYTKEYEKRKYVINSDSTLFEKIIVTSFLGIDWPANNFGPLLLITLVAIILFWKKLSRYEALLFGGIWGSLLFWHLTHANQLHYVFFIFPCIALILAVILSSFRSSLIVSCTTVFFLALPLLQSGLTSLHSPIYLSSLYLADSPLFANYINAKSKYFRRATLVDTLASIHPNYRILQIERFSETRVRDSFKHVLNDYAQYRTLTLVLQSPTTNDLIQTMREQGITHIFTDPRDRAKNRRNSTGSHEYTDLIDGRLQALFAALPIEIQNEDGIIYRIPERE